MRLRCNDIFNCIGGKIADNQGEEIVKAFADCDI